MHKTWWNSDWWSKILLIWNSNWKTSTLHLTKNPCPKKEKFCNEVEGIYCYCKKENVEPFQHNISQETPPRPGKSILRKSILLIKVSKVKEERMRGCCHMFSIPFSSPTNTFWYWRSSSGQQQHHLQYIQLRYGELQKESTQKRKNKSREWQF